MLRVFLLLLFCLLGESFIHTFTNHHSRSLVLHDIEIRLQGTANAYTTLRNYDTVLYALDEPIGDKSISIGVYRTDLDNENTGGIDGRGMIIPLRGIPNDDEIFYYDDTRVPLSVTELHENDKILRIVSSGRKGEKCVVVDEYLDVSSIFYQIE